jgi:hypothetical protein
MNDVTTVEVLGSMDSYGYIPGGGDLSGGGPGPLPRIRRPGAEIPLQSGEVPPGALVMAAADPGLFGPVPPEWMPQPGETFAPYWERVLASWRAQWDEARRIYGPAHRAHFEGR